MHPQLLEASATCLVAMLMAAYAAARSERSAAQSLIVALMLAVMIWTFGVATSHVVAGTLSKWAALGAFCGIFFVPPCWLLLSVELAHLRRPALGRRLIGLVLFPSFAFLALLLTNQSHRLFIATPDSFSWTESSDWAGPLFWVWAAWAYPLVIVGNSLYLFRAFRKMNRHELGRALMLAGAALIPLFASVVYTVVGFQNGADRTPLFLGVSIFVLFLADWRYHLLDTIPLARCDVIDHLEDGVIVADASGRILDMNPSAEMMIESQLSQMRGRLLVEVVAEQAQGRMDYDAKRFMEMIRELCESPGGFSVQVENYAGLVYEIRGSSLKDVDGGVSALYLILRDRTEDVKYEGSLSLGPRVDGRNDSPGDI